MCEHTKVHKKTPKILNVLHWILQNVLHIVLRGWFNGYSYP
jgi:hypothetical protein